MGTENYYCNQTYSVAFRVDYQAQYSSSNMSMPGNNSVVIPVLSLNTWITIQNKVTNGQTTFVQNWLTYRNGFGTASLVDNYWIGNEFIYQLTSRVTYCLRIEVTITGAFSWEGEEIELTQILIQSN